MVSEIDKALFREVFNFLNKWKNKEITPEAFQELESVCLNSNYDKCYAQRLMFATCDYIVAHSKKG